MLACAKCGLMYSHTISPLGVTWKKRPFMPSSMNVLPFGSRSALLMKEL